MFAITRRIMPALFALLAWIGTTRADVTMEISGAPSVMYDPLRDGCAPIDVPDLNPRAFRDASGAIVMFALHYENRPLRGPDLAHLKLDCHVALGSPLDGDPAHYADRNYLTATWTKDGKTVAAMVHHEYHGDDFHRCSAGSMGCWYNSILSYRSTDGGLDFNKTAPLVVASAPFRQEIEQGRHRGFFNPSNIVSDGRFQYALISTTGWTGQPYGNCLFRSADPDRAGSWRAFDGKSFSVRYDDPYRGKPTSPKPCAAIGPFTFAVGSIVRHRESGTWIALMQASAGAAMTNDGGTFPFDGFYYATSRDLIHWGEARLLLAGKTLYGDLCKAGSSIIGYPSVIDGDAKSRNFDDAGDHPDLVFTTMRIENCQTGQRLIVRERLTIKTSAKS